MNKHKFEYAGFLNDRKVYIVKCKKTKGKFSTALWDYFKLKRNKCACCSEKIE